ncbi:MAG: hypothetical protein EU542_01455 [Promethearchaeota archaeon]|nr:MAG: hypothetical protein EU542_01455 [Candidatus Lokiarchaeota archaeon]
MTPNVLFYAFNFMINNIIMYYSLIYDLKYRKIPNIFFKHICLVIFFSNSIDFILYSNSIRSFVIVKFLIICLLFLITFFLFNLKFIGGADAKLIITLFLMIPINFFSFSLIFEYLILFSIFQVLYLIFNFINNFIFRNKSSFKQFFIINNNFSKLEQLYFILFYRFSNYSELDLSNKYKIAIRDINLFFNFKHEKFQILTQYRPPLIIIIILLYYFLFII